MLLGNVQLQSITIGCHQLNQMFKLCHCADRMFYCCLRLTGAVFSDGPSFFLCVHLGFQVEHLLLGRRLRRPKSEHCRFGPALQHSDSPRIGRHKVACRALLENRGNVLRNRLQQA